jgi:hypothetical protein
VLSTFVNYQVIARDIGKSISRVQAEPMVKRETDYYLANIKQVKSVKDFVGNDRLFRYAMKAHGLADMAYAKAFMVKALEGGIDAKESFANNLADKRYRDFVETFNFARHGETTTVFTRAQQGTVDRYLRQTLEENAGAQNEGVRLALYFERKAGTIKDSYDILADPALTKVVFTALGLPASFSSADIDKQAALIADRIDFEDLKTASGKADLLKRFTSLWEIDNPSASAASSAALLFQPVEYGISTDLLLTLQRLK